MHSQAIVADFMVRIYGGLGGKAIAVLICDCVLWFGVWRYCSDIRAFPTRRRSRGSSFQFSRGFIQRESFPMFSVLAMGFCSALACLLSLESLITALIVTQTVLQFAAQCVAVMLLRRQKRKSAVEPIGCRLYPLPALIALAGWIYIVVTSGAPLYRASPQGCWHSGLRCFCCARGNRAQWPFAEVAA